MGYGAYSYTSHQALTNNREGKSAQTVFTQSRIHPSMNPYGVVTRESRDSADNPSSLAIVFSLDISGSMGSIPRQLALKELPEFMKMLTVCKIPDPQVLFMAFSDHEYDGRPLQVGQFETTAELMDQWLTRCSLRGGGERAPSYSNNTGQAFESYDLAFHFAARHTAIDCHEKRNKKGYLFVTGDEDPYPGVRAEVVKHVIGTDIQDDSFAGVIAETKKMYEPFFLVPDRSRYRKIKDAWHSLLGDRVIPMHSPSHTCAVAAALVGLGEGQIQGEADLRARLAEANYTDIDAVLDALSGWINSKERV
jgi:hypothetical protein